MKIKIFFFTFLLVNAFTFKVNAQDGTNDFTFNPTDHGGGAPGTNGFVKISSVQSDGKIIIGGGFTLYNGISVKNIARLNSDWTLDTTFHSGFGADSTVSSISIQSDGKIVIGGWFKSYNGTIRNHIARLNSDGTLDISYNPIVNDRVSVSTIQGDGKIIIGGAFTSCNSTVRYRIARLNTDGTLDTSFNPSTTRVDAYASNSVVVSISLQGDGKIIIGGSFISSTIGKHKFIERLNSDGTLDNSFYSENNIYQPTLYTTAIQSDGKIIIGGAIGINNCIQRLNADGTKDNSFNPGTGANNTIYAVTVQDDGKIIVGGAFSAFNGIVKQGIVRINSDGSLDNSFKSNPGLGSSSSYVRSMVIQSDGAIIIYGSFSQYNGVDKRNIAKLNSDGTLDYSLSTGADDGINSILIQSDKKIIIGGWFKTYNGVIKDGIARLNTDGSLDNSFNFENSEFVYTTAMQSDKKIIIGGSLNPSDDITKKNIARLNSDGTLDLSFNSEVTISAYNSIAIQNDGKILIGAYLTSDNGIAQNGVIRLNQDGTIDKTFNIGTGADNANFSLAIQSDGKILVGGSFTSYNGISRNKIIRLNSDGTLDLSFNFEGDTVQYINDIAIQSDGKIIIGGLNLFYTSNISRLNSDGTLDKSFNFDSKSYRGEINSIIIQNDGKILVGGSFSSYNNGIVKSSGIAILNSDGSLDTSFNPGTGTNDKLGQQINLGVYKIGLQCDGKIIIGGVFEQYNGIGRNRICRILNLTANPPDTLFCEKISTWGISNIDQFVGISIYPNPISNELTIDNREVGTTTHFEILNVFGQVIVQGELTDKKVIETAHFAPGIYLVKLENEKGIGYQKIVKE